MTLFALPAHAVPVVHPVEVMASVLNVRSGPGSSHAVIGSVRRQQVYISIDRQGAWHKLWFDSGTGWAHGNYLTDVANEYRAVTAGTLNVRRGPGAQYSIVGTMPRDSKWAIVDTAGAWKQVYYGGAAHWAHGNYLNEIDPNNPDNLPTSSAGFVQLPATGRGFVRMSPAAESWGLPTLVYGLMSAGHDLNGDHQNWGEMAIRDLSLENGGRMPGHASHRLGEDVDIRLLRNDAKPWGTTIYSSLYDRSRNLSLITDYLNINIDLRIMFFNDSTIFSKLPGSTANRRDECTTLNPGPNNLSYVMCWPNHHNHLHLRQRR